MRRLRSATGLALTLPTALAAIATLTILPQDAAAQTPRRGGKIVIARSADITVWDPKYTNDTLTIQAQHQIYSTLLENAPDGKSVRPSLAESYTISEDGRAYTFKLRPTAKFCDGSPITAADVKFSFDRAMEKDSRVPWQFPNQPAVDVIDPATVRITLDKPNVAFARYLTLWGTQVVSKAYTEKVGQQEMGQKPLGSGAFCVDRFVKGQVTTLKRNPGYWDPERPYLDEVELRVVQDENAAVLQLRSGQVDVALSVPFSQAESAEAGARRGPEHGHPRRHRLDRAQPEDGPGRQRRESAHGDADGPRPAGAWSMHCCSATASPPSRRSTVRGVLYHTRDFGIPYDVEKAKKLMAESGFPKGFSAKLLIPERRRDGRSGRRHRQGSARQDRHHHRRATDRIRHLVQHVVRRKVRARLQARNQSRRSIRPRTCRSISGRRRKAGRNAAFSGYRNDEIVKISKAAEGEHGLRQAGHDVSRAAAYRDVGNAADLPLPPVGGLCDARTRCKGFEVFPTRLHPPLGGLDARNEAAGPPPSRLGAGARRGFRIAEEGRREFPALRHDAGWSSSLPVLFGIVVIVFLFVRLIPGDPASIMLGTYATPEALAALRADLGLDQPLWAQFAIFMGDVVEGQLGTSHGLSPAGPGGRPRAAAGDGIRSPSTPWSCRS